MAATIGYREAFAVVNNQMTIEEAKMQMKHNTRVFVRRQGNWFKENDPQIRWFDMNTETLQAVEAYIQKVLFLE